MMIRKAALIVVVFMACVTGTAFRIGADEASRRAAAEELLEAMDMPKTMETMYELMKGSLSQQMMSELGTSDRQAEETERNFNAALTFLEGEMSWDNTKEDYIKIYAEAFTEEELREMTAFFSTTTGRKFIKKQPELMQSGADIGQRQLMEIVPKYKQFLEELRKKNEASQSESE